MIKDYPLLIFLLAIATLIYLFIADTDDKEGQSTINNRVTNAFGDPLEPAVYNE